MTTTRFKLYRDGDRWIVGPERQSSNATSITEGYAETYHKSSARAIIAQLSVLNDEELEKRLRDFNTWDRFESACDAGRYGPEW